MISGNVRGKSVSRRNCVLNLGWCGNAVLIVDGESLSRNGHRDAQELRRETSQRRLQRGRTQEPRVTAPKKMVASEVKTTTTGAGRIGKEELNETEL
jgi:hypothetical protein